MKTWIVRFVSLYVFDLVVLLVVGALLPNVQVGWAALWGAVILTVATIWVKPAIGAWLRRAADKHRGGVGRAGRKAIEYGSVFLVALAVWLLVVVLTGVRADGLLVGYLLPPVLLLVAWAIYDRIDDVLERRASALYDRARGGVQADRQAASVSDQSSAASEAGRRELRDGLTDEQRRMLDGL